MKDVRSKPAMRIWLDVGRKEPGTAVYEARQLRDALVRKGWKVGKDLSYSEIEGGTHDEGSFAKRAEPFLRYLFPPR